MSDQQDHVLLSAYVDGELTPDERARVEQLLASSAEARQLVDELRALRASLQELPQHRLDAEFASRVLAQAQHEPGVAESRDAYTARPAANAPGQQAQHAPVPIRPTVFRTWRGIAWAAVAVAAALVVLVTNRPADHDRNVALAPARQEKEQVVDKLAAGENVPQETIATTQSAPQSAIKTEAGSSLSQPPSQDIAGRSAASRAPQLDRDAAGTFVQQTGKRAVVSQRNQVVVIHVGVTDEAARRGEFQQLLARHHLVANEADGASFGAFEEKSSSDRGGELPATPGKQLMREALSAAPPEKAAANVLYVEASLSQIDSALADLDASPRSFPTVEVATASPAPRQRESAEDESVRNLGAVQTPQSGSPSAGPSASDAPPIASYQLAPASRLDRAQSTSGPNESDQLLEPATQPLADERFQRSLQDSSAISGESTSVERNKEIREELSRPGAAPAASAPSLSTLQQDRGGAAGGLADELAESPRVRAVFVLRIVDRAQSAETSAEQSTEESTSGAEK